MRVDYAYFNYVSEGGGYLGGTFLHGSEVFCN